MDAYTFTLVLEGVHELTTELEDAVFETYEGDAGLGVVDGIAVLDFLEHEAGSAQEAILSTIEAIEEAGIDARVIRVEPDDLVTAAEIANRTGRTRESIRLLAVGKRGKSRFPAPVRGTSTRTRLWRWENVLNWMRKQYPGDEGLCRSVKEESELARAIPAINGALALRRYGSPSVGVILRRLSVA